MAKKELKDFVSEEQARALAFKMRWMEAHFKDPDHYPLELEPGEWDSQFMDFDASVPFLTCADAKQES